VRIRDLSASNDRYLQTHCLSLPNKTWIVAMMPDFSALE
jgi:hypothetical protein